MMTGRSLSLTVAKIEGVWEQGMAWLLVQLTQLWLQDLDDYAPEPEVHAYLKDRFDALCARQLSGPP